MRKICLLLFLIVLPSFGQKKEGQKLIDSLLIALPKAKEDTLKINLLNNISNTYQFINPILGIEYANKALKISNQNKWSRGIVNSYQMLSSNYLQNNSYQKSIIYAEKAIRLTKNKVLITNLLNDEALAYQSLNNYPKALFFHNKSLSISESLHDKKRELISLVNIGNLYYNLKDYDKALLFYKRSLNIKYKDDDRKYLVLINIGGTYTLQKKIKTALLYFNKALELNLKNKNFPNVTDTYIHIGSGYNTINEFDKAIFSFRKALEIDKKINDFYNESTCYEGLGQSYFGKKDFFKALDFFQKAEIINKRDKNNFLLVRNLKDLGKTQLEIYKSAEIISDKKNTIIKAIQNFNKSIDINKNLGDLKNISDNYELLSQAQKLNGNYKDALVCFQKSIVFKDSIFNSDTKETLKNLEDKREIELRDKEIKINKLAIESQQKQKWFYILGIGFLIILGGLLFYQSRNRLKNNEKLQVLNSELDTANKTKTRFFSILNHDLRSPVSNLIHFLHLQQDNPELLDDETKKRMQSKTITGAENLLSSMEDILLWSKGQMENFEPQPKKISVKQLFDDTKKVFSGYFKIHFEYHNPENLEIFTDENYLKTIIRNLTSNAINIFSTTKNPSIIWKAYQTNNQVFLSITDNGSGSSQEKFKALFDDSEVVGIKTGLGLHLIRDLAKAINCEIFVESKIGLGTTFILKFNA